MPSSDLIIVIAFLLFLAVMLILDVAMLVSLVRPGDERRMMIVWKSSTWTLIGTMGSLAISTVECIVRSERLCVNPFITLSVAAMLYFVCLLYYRKKYGG